MRKSILCAAALLVALTASAQGQPAGSVVYSLPQTVIRITVEAQREAFTAGPYAQYAQKYLGVAARTSSETTYRLDKIDMVPFTEADPQYRYAVTIPEKSSINFFQFCSQGLVAVPGAFNGQSTSWSFTPQAGAERWEGIDPEGNLGVESTTLYKAVATAEGYQKVPVSQDNVVEKSLDRKAADAAAVIFSLREKRQQIATGDTDATFSGEALQSAIDEITRLEEKYLSLFYGASDISIVKKSFDIVPSQGDSKRTAFRISNSQGLVSGSQSDGKAVVLEFYPEKLSGIESAGDRGRETTAVHYRVPAVVLCRLTEDGNILAESRIPVYQMGQECTYPLNVLISK